MSTMTIKKETWKKAQRLVAKFTPEKAIAMSDCGCFGCGYGCSGTVGM